MMKKTVVFIVERYYPNYSAVGVCAGNIIQELTSKYNIIVITKKQFNGENFINYNNHYIVTYSTKDNNIRNYIDEKLKITRGYKRNFYVFLKNIVRGLGYLGAILKNENIKNQDVRAIYKKLEDIQGSIDIIIPTCLPIENIIASINYKNNVSSHTKIMPLLFDKFSENSTLHRTEMNKNKKFSKHLLIEKKILEQCDKLMFVEAWREHINKYFTEHKEKFLQIEHPLIKKINVINSVQYDSKKINIVYTGVLYRKIRSPLKVLEFFENLIKKDNRIAMHFYVTGDCDFIIQEYSRRYPQNIICYGEVKSDIAKSAITNADILLSIGNTDVTQLPSKIFEYISTGNPVTHFYSEKEDPVIEILKRYKSSICVWNEDKYIENIETNILEIANNPGSKMRFDEIEDIYKDATPKYTADIIMELIDN